MIPMKYLGSQSIRRVRSGANSREAGSFTTPYPVALAFELDSGMFYKIAPESTDPSCISLITDSLVKYDSLLMKWEFSVFTMILLS